MVDGNEERAPSGGGGSVLRRAGGAAAAILLAGAIGFLAFGPAAVERIAQGVLEHPPYQLSDAARSLHAQLEVVDWHSDTLLWSRDLLERSDRGHVDLPRLQEGNVAVQVFTAVTKAPTGQNYSSNSGESDMVTALALLQRWPAGTWSSLLARALHQAARLDDAIARSSGELVWVRSREELAHLREARRSGRNVTGALMGLEGSHALEARLENLAVLDEAGFRMIGLQHFFDNALGGSLHGEQKGGLTDFGRQVVTELEEREIIIDLSHSSTAVVDDVLAMATRPVVVSHTGVHGACPTERNIPDEQIRRIAEAGGLIAIGFWDGAVCDVSPRGVVAAIRFAIDLVGVDHVALGSDFDGGTRTRFDASELGVLTHAMLAEGLRPEEIAKVMGGNSMRFLAAALPSEAGVASPRP